MGILYPVDELTLSDTIPTFNDLEKEAFWKHCGEKEKMLVTSIFSFSHNAFLPYQRKIAPFELHLNCRLQMLSVWTRLKICRLVQS